ncbi:MAG: hypothetical protein R3293_25080 [Candidatus Promineifilaceae bacterium]|nr:hypothetical protein [Candidatus Promineifilaceae bacterium]
MDGLPDIPEDVWVLAALGPVEEAQHIIDGIPEQHPFELHYKTVEKAAWESCRTVPDGSEKRRIVRKAW